MGKRQQASFNTNEERFETATQPRGRELGDSAGFFIVCLPPTPEPLTKNAIDLLFCHLLLENKVLWGS